MRIRLLATIQNARGAFRRGQVVDWPEEDARALIDARAAAAIRGKPAKNEPASAGEPEGDR